MHLCSTGQSLIVTLSFLKKINVPQITLKSRRGESEKRQTWTLLPKSTTSLVLLTCKHCMKLNAYIKSGYSWENVHLNWNLLLWLLNLWTLHKALWFREISWASGSELKFHIVKGSQKSRETKITHRNIFRKGLCANSGIKQVILVICGYYYMFSNYTFRWLLKC